LKPIRFIIGMVNAPEATTLATEDPEIEPNSAELEGGGDHAEHGLLGGEGELDDAIHRHPGMTEFPRQVGAEIELQKEQDGDDRYRRPENPAAGFEHDDDGDGAHGQVPLAGIADPEHGVGHILVHPVADGCHREHDHDEVDDAWPVLRRAAPRRKSQKHENRGEQEIEAAVGLGGYQAEAGGVHVPDGEAGRDQPVDDGVRARDGALLALYRRKPAVE
jgi:hypothetical protein